MDTYILLFSFLLLPFFGHSQYKFTKKDAATLGIVSAVSFLDGVLEGYQFDGRRSFERKYGVSPTGFFGSKSWTQKKFLNQTWDFYHIGEDARKLGYIYCGVRIGLNRKPNWKHFCFDILIQLTASSLSKRLGMTWIRN